MDTICAKIFNFADFEQVSACTFEILIYSWSIFVLIGSGCRRSERIRRALHPTPEPCQPVLTHGPADRQQHGAAAARSSQTSVPK